VYTYINSSAWPISKAQIRAEPAHITYAVTKTTSTQMNHAKCLVAEYGGNDVKSDQTAMENTTLKRAIPSSPEKKFKHWSWPGPDTFPILFSRDESFIKSLGYRFAALLSPFYLRNINREKDHGANRLMVTTDDHTMPVLPAIHSLLLATCVAFISATSCWGKW
jgi:hypothetical protein